MPVRLKGLISAVCLAALIVLLGILQSSPLRGEEQRAGVKEFPGVTVVTLTGSSREMGYQHGQLLGKRFLETEAAFKKLMPRLPGGSVGRWFVRQFVMLQAARIEKYLTPDELDELKGMADSDPEKSGSYKDFLYYHVLQDIGQNYACTGAAATGERSSLDGPIVGRNFDMDRRGLLDKLRTVFYYRPSEGMSYVSIAWPGMAGAVSGMNEAGLAVMEFSAKSRGTTLAGVPVAFLVKRVLREASDVDQAVGIIRNARRMGPNIFLLADKRRAIAVEFDSETLGTREFKDGILPVSNHFLTASFADDEKNRRQIKYSDSRMRFMRIKTSLDGCAKVGVADMLAALRDHRGTDGKELAWGDYGAVNNIKDAHSVIFDPAGLRFYVSTGTYAYGGFAGFKITGTGLERVETLPEDAYPESDDGRRAMASDVLLMKAEDEEAGLERGARMDLAQRALSADPDNYLAALWIGETCIEDGTYKKASEAFTRTIGAAPAGTESRAKALAGRGEAEMELGKTEEARADFAAALAAGSSEAAEDTAKRGLGKI